MGKLLSAVVISAIAFTAACSDNALTGPVSSTKSTRVSGSLMTQSGWADNGCRTGDTIIAVGPGNEYDTNNDYSICQSSNGYYDNRVKTGSGGGGWVDGCRAGDTLILVGPEGSPYDKNFDLAICWSGTRYYDNQLEGGNGGGGGGWEGGCRVGDTLLFVQFSEYDKNGDLAVCYTGSDYYDNRLSH